MRAGKGIWEREEQAGKRFKLSANGNLRQTRDFPTYRSNGSIARLLTDAGTILKLPGTAKKIYTETGTAVNSLDKIPENSVLVISCGEPFVHRSDPATLKQKLKARIKDVHTGTPSTPSPEKTKPHRSFDAVSTRSEMTAITVSAQPKSRYARYHQLLAVLPGSVEDHIRDSMLATYVTMDDPVKSELEDNLIYEDMLRKTQYYLFTDQLVQQGLSGQFAASIVDDPLNTWAQKQLDEIPVTKVRFVIAGSRSSGKTMSLCSLASIFYRKLLCSTESDDWLMFPLNMELHSLYMDDPVQFYSVVMNNLFKSLHYSRFELFPHFLALKEWFLVAPTIGTMAKLPQGLWDLSRVDADALRDLGRECHDAFHKGLEADSIFKLVFSLPNKLAAALKMKGAVYVIDHSDYASPEVAAAISESVRKSPFILASKESTGLAEIYTIRNCVTLAMQGAMDFDSDKYITLSGAGTSVEIDADTLMGCPGFIAMFGHVCNVIESTNAMPVMSSHSLITSKIDDSRRVIMNQEVSKLCLALATAESQSVTFDVVNSISGNELSMRVNCKN